MTLTNDIRARILALYYNQRVFMVSKDARVCQPNNEGFWKHDDGTGCLLLTSLEKISDEQKRMVLGLGEDCTEITFAGNCYSYKSMLKNVPCTNYGVFFPVHYDRLRLIGVAVSYLDFSVNDLVKAGVFKIKEE